MVSDAAVARVVALVCAGSRFGDAVREVSAAEGYDVRQTVRLRDAARLTLQEVGPTDRCTLDVLGVSSYRCRCADCVDARDAIATVLERHRLPAPAPVPDVEAAMRAATLRTRPTVRPRPIAVGVAS